MTMKMNSYLKSLFLLICLLCGVVTSAHDFEVDGIYYQRNGTNTVSVTYQGYNSWSSVYSGDIVIPDVVTYDGTSYTVTSIHQSAFAYCRSLTSVTLPSTLTSIEREAFYNCIQLSDISFPAQLTSIDTYAFYCCSTLTRLVIPKALVTINMSAFGHCAKVTSIEVENGNPKYDSRNNCNAIIETASNTLVRGCENTVIPNTVTTIGSYAFDGCYGLTSMEIPNSVTTIQSDAFNGCVAMTSVTIPSSVTSIDARAFRFCKSLRSITIPNTITKIETDLFYNCISLATINLPNTIEEVGWGAFYNTAWLNNQPDGVVYVNQIAYQYKGTAPTGTSVTINDGTKSIVREAFLDCKGLSEIIIPGSVCEIGYQAFKGCTNLQNAVIGGADGEQHMKIRDEAFSGCTALASVTIGNSVSYLDDEAFEGCDNLRTINIFDIEAWLNVDFYVSSYNYSNPFYSLEHLYLNGSEIEHLVIPNTVNGIRSYAFYACQRLKTIDIPNNVSSIGYGAFYLCDSITSIICRASYPPSLYGYTGSNSPTFSSYNATVQVPMDHLADYQSDSKWSNFSNIVGFNDRFNIDGINYRITSTNSVSVVSHNLEYEYEKELTIPGHVDFEGVTYAVTDIAAEAFRDCSFLKSVVIPNTVITIGTSAFEYCNGLREVTIGNSVDSIGNSAFRGCHYLNHVALGNSVVSIGDYAFDRDNYGPSGEYEPCELIIPSSVESIGAYAFSGWWEITSINLHSVKTIGEGAFGGCCQLTKVILGSNLTSVGRGAFACRYEIDGYYYSDYEREFWEYVNNLDLDILCLAPVPPTCQNTLVSDVMLEKTHIAVLADALDDYMSAPVWEDIPEIYPLMCDFMVDGICYRIRDEYMNEVELDVPWCEGYYFEIGNDFYSGDISIPEVVNYNGQDYTVTYIGTFFSGNTGITSIRIPSTITLIDEYAFSGCTNLTSVYLPNSITYIGEYAFSNCTSLTSINFPASLYGIGNWAFEGCESLMNIDLPNTLVEIGNYSFSGCISLTSVFIPASVRYIASNPFYECSNLTQIVVSSDNTTFDSRNNCNAIIETATNTLMLGCKNTIIPNTVTIIGYAAFSGCSGLTSINIPNSVTTIEGSAFSGCSSLTAVEIPNSVTTIGSSAFYQCSSLTAVEIPNSVTSIGSSAFKFCSNLTNLSIGNSVTSIGNDAFYYCSGLTAVEIPNSVTTIGSSAFSYCSNLSDITIPNSVVFVGNNAFYSTKWYSNQPDGLVYAGSVAYKYKGTMPSNTSIVLRDSTVSVTDNAFYNCKGLENITFPETMNKIGSYAFYGCTGLTSIEFPSAVTSIGSDAFYGCTGLSSIEIPGAVTYIGSYAFYNCTGLNDITCLASTPPSMDYNAFSNSTYSSAILRVPTASISAYKAAYQWKNFANVVGLLAVGDIIEVDSIYYQVNEGGIVSVYSRGEENNPYCGDVVVPDNIDYYGTGFIVTSIAEQAFQDCDELTSISIPNSVVSIGNNAFDGCAALSSIIIPDSVTTIGEQAFQGCTGLTAVTIGSSVTSIGAKAFNYCNALQTVTSKSDVPPVMANSNCFTNSGYRATLRVPREAIETYQAANYWYKFSKIEAIAELGDLNGDGLVDVSDVTGLIDLLLNGGEESPVADVNGDSRVDISDVTTLIMYLLSGN